MFPLSACLIFTSFQGSDQIPCLYKGFSEHPLHSQALTKVCPLSFPKTLTISNTVFLWFFFFFLFLLETDSYPKALPSEEQFIPLLFYLLDFQRGPPLVIVSKCPLGAAKCSVGPTVQEVCPWCSDFKQNLKTIESFVQKSSCCLTLAFLITEKIQE
jgi:hypothetical protein